MTSMASMANMARPEKMDTAPPWMNIFLQILVFEMIRTLHVISFVLLFVVLSTSATTKKGGTEVEKLRRCYKKKLNISMLMEDWISALQWWTSCLVDWWKREQCHRHHLWLYFWQHVDFGDTLLNTCTGAVAKTLDVESWRNAAFRWMGFLLLFWRGCSLIIGLDIRFNPLVFDTFHPIVMFSGERAGHFHFFNFHFHFSNFHFFLTLSTQ